MPIEQNIPATIRNWAFCLVEIQRYEAVIRRLDSGCWFSIGTYGICKSFIGRHGSAGKKKFLEEFCIPEAARLKRRCARYRALADRIRRNSSMPPERWLLSKEEALSLIGSTLHYGRHGKSCYDTLQSCSEDGGQIYSSRHACPTGLTPLSLLSLGFGKAL